MAIPVVVLGNKLLTLEVAKFLLHDPQFHLSGLIIGENSSLSQSAMNLEQFARSHNIPCYGFESIEHIKCESRIGVSIGYPHILKRSQIEAFGQIINLHFGELPWYRGSGTVSHAILNGETTFGMTLHRIDVGVDTGPIYRIERFPIRQDALASDVIGHGEVVGLQMVRESLAQICHGEILETPQESLLAENGRTSTQYYRKSLGVLRVLDGLQSAEALVRQYRAGHLPGRPPPVIQFGSHYFAAKDLRELKNRLAESAGLRSSLLTMHKAP